MIKKFYVNEILYGKFAPCIDIDLSMQDFEQLQTDDRHGADIIIANVLSISYEEYTNLLQKYGAYYTNAMGFIFDRKEDVQPLVDYLNNKYLLVLKLQGKV